MKLPKRYWLVVILGITVFLAAFAVAFAATWFQGSQVVPSVVNVQTTVIISGDQMFALWRDEAMTEPVISGDGPHITFLQVETIPPLRQSNFVRTQPIFIQNVSDTFARPIEPCHEVIIGGQPAGSVSAHLRTLGSTDQDRGNTCDDGRIGEMMSPGEKWMMDIHIELNQPLPEGDNLFDLVIGGIGVTGDVPRPIQPPAGMVSWWPGDGNANDIVDGNHGILSGDATATADGMVGQAFSFDGTGDFVEVPHNANLNLAQFSVDAWVFIDPALNAGQINAFVGKSNGAGGGGGFWLIHDDRRLPASIDNTTNALRFTVLGGPGISSDASLKNAVPEAGFYHLAGVFDGSQARLYLNGTLAATGPVIAGVLFNTLPLRIGAMKDIGFGSDDRFEGLIDEVELFDRALTEAEIKAIFEAGSAGKRKPQPVEPPAGMISWWPGDGHAQDIVDGNDGALQNGATFAQGMVGQAFSFDGVNDFVDTQATVGLTGAQARSIDLWVNIAADGGGLGAIPVGYGFAGTDQLFALAITKPGGGLSGGRNVFFSGFFNDLLGFMPISLNTWHHIAVTYDGTTLAIYVDGVLDASALKSLGTIDSVLSMGKAISGGWTPFNGLIDEVELFDRALTEAEIKAIFEAGSAGKRKP